MPSLRKLLSFSNKVFKFNEFVAQFQVRRKFKQIIDAPVLLSIVSGLMSGLHSLNSISQGSGPRYSRSVLENFLQVEGLPRKLRRYVASLIKKMKRGKMINLEHVQGKTIASVDGIETYRRSYTPDEFFSAILKDVFDRHCQVAVHRNKTTNEVERFDVYHRLVVICIISDRGPMPVGWAYQESDAYQQYKEWLLSNKKNAMPNTEEDSAEKLKQEGELSTLKKLLKSLHEDFSRAMPFDVLIGDGLYDKSTVLTAVESYGVALVSVLKDERRSLRQEADQEFTTNAPQLKWCSGQRDYEGWWAVFEDKNITRLENKVRVVRVIRRKNQDSVDNYFYCSNVPWMKPCFVEWCRFYRWKEENGFNAWTNQWQLLKHVFHSSFAACDAMIGLIFLSIILLENYRKGYLKRGNHSCKLSLKLFFRELIKGISFNCRKSFLVFFEEELAPST